MSGTDAFELVSALGGWRERRGPSYRRLAEALRDALVAGRFPVGTVLPPERRFAEALGVSRTTVVGAYEMLRAEGWLESVQGSGTRVRREAPSRASAAPLAAQRRHSAFRGLVDSGGTAVSFLGLHLPAIAPDFEETLAETARDSRSLLRGHGYSGLGLAPLREAIARHLTTGGLPTRSSEVLVTHGAQQAIGLAAQLLLRRGDAVVLEDPTYLGAIDLFEATGARLVTVPVGPAGVRLERLAAAVEREHPRAIYLMPTFQNPVGPVIPEEARREIAAIADRHGTVVVEDGTLEDLDFGTRPPPPIAAFCRSGRGVTIGSLSKLIWGGLRVGWLRAPAALLDAAAELKVMSDLGNSPLSQTLATRLMRRLPDIRTRRRAEIVERFEVLASELTRRLPEWEWTRPLGGLSVWVRLPRGDAEEFGAVARRHGVAILPGSVFSPSNGHADHIRLPFCLEPDEIRDGIARLSRAWAEYVPASAGRPSERPLHVVV
ncbi:MAG TPA: PLP-dependent aminotransferase family protein [Thermoanaerobaculia bacterium]|nr:PLP-dependent aminotransferase family protein [Thermoanaerobaculia bacterium]